MYHLLKLPSLRSVVINDRQKIASVTFVRKLQQLPINYLIFLCAEILPFAIISQHFTTFRHRIMTNITARFSLWEHSINVATILNI